MKPLVIVCLLFSSIHCIPVANKTNPTPSENFPFHATLDTDGNFLLYWKFNATHITFETHVRTKGYVGFGFSTNGKMFPADVVTGWIKDGVPHFQDRHTVGHSPPVVDASQDWFLLHGEENGFGTVLKMIRKLDTCDPNDMKISNDTIRAIFAYSPNDPADDNSITYHGPTHRGAKSLMLLTRTKIPAIPSDALTKDFLNDNYHVPANDTTYSCRIFSLADITKKHHVVKFEPIIQTGHVPFVHHIVVMKCPAVDPSLIGYQYMCDTGKVKPCGNAWVAWATGGEAFYFPDNVGLPVGEPGDTDVIIMQTHYNNPGLKTGIVDSSGMRITYTPTLRHHDAGCLSTGVLVNPWQLVPPGIQDFRSAGFCPKECLSKGLSNMKSGINVFGILQHAHLLARGIRTRIYRKGVELAPLAVDEHYDFDYQDFRYVHGERTVLDGDEIVTECKYDSTGRKGITIGGESTSQEMCLSFMFYYPRMVIDTCEAVPKFDNIDPDFTKMSKKLFHMDFTNKTVVDEYMHLLNTTRYLTYCAGATLQPNYTIGEGFLPRPTKEYVEPSTCPHS
ncbi:hypothetical protein FSP39_012921 [Pinctada imbricata]|uniref:DOMON domain-containing protein n=1 Tax=Pinctada imbricata TaxID=66713 RepID=A0AA88XUI4_PINIB|nr:hypothetical protein FSP39_012921 [Pinctada imbricata]